MPTRVPTGSPDKEDVSETLFITQSPGWKSQGFVVVSDGEVSLSINSIFVRVACWAYGEFLLSLPRKQKIDKKYAEESVISSAYP